MEHTQPSLYIQPVIPPPLLNDASTITFKSNLQSGGTLHNQPYTSVTEESKKACRNFLHMKRLSEDEEHDYIFLFSYYPVRPVIQNGPVCGLVALAMASELASGSNVTTGEILSEARTRGFSKQGEMFSASDLQELAAYFLPCKVARLHLQHSSTAHSPGRDLIEQLMLRNLVLIPYDADKNHAPCQKQGHKAHWALLTGFFVAVKAADAPVDLLSHCERETGVPNLYYWPDDPEPLLCDQLAQLVSSSKAGEFFVLGHQGKSKYAGLWHLNDLLLSNGNLLEAGPERDSENYVMPPGGVEAGLRSQAITVHIKVDR